MSHFGVLYGRSFVVQHSGTRRPMPVSLAHRHFGFYHDETSAAATLRQAVESVGKSIADFGDETAAPASVTAVTQMDVNLAKWSRPWPGTGQRLELGL